MGAQHRGRSPGTGAGHGRWRTGTAAFRPDDDIRARARSFATGRVSAAAVAFAMRATESDPISVRISYTD